MSLALIAAALLKVTAPEAEAPAIERDAPQADEAAGAAAFARAMAVKELPRQLADLDSALDLLPRPTRYRGMVQCYRGWVLSELSRRPQSDAAIEECYRLRPDDPWAMWEMASVLLTRRDLNRGTRLLIAAINADPAPLASYSAFTMESTLRELDHAREDKLRAELLLALSGTEYGKDDPLWTSNHARRTIDGLLAKGDREGAVRMLPLILAPRIGLELLVDRRYEAIWPDIERWAGGDLRAQRDAYVTAAKAAFELDPSLDLRRNYADALAAAGRPEEARALLRAALEDRAQWDKDRHEIAMIAIRLATMLAGEGRTDEALAVLRAMKAAAPPAQFPFTRNVVAAEAQFLTDAGRHAEALALLDREAPQPDPANASHAFIPAMRLCALRGLGHDEEARQVAAALQRDFAMNLPAQRFAASCGAGAEARRRLWLESLDAPESRSGALLAWLEAERARDPVLAGDPQTRATFERYGRRLPRSFDDALAGWRTASR